MQHLKASTFTEPTLPIDWLSQSVQDYIRTVTESYGCPQDFVVAICLITAGIAAGKKVQLSTNPYTNYPCDFVCLVGNPSRNKTGPLKEVTSPLREYDKANFAKYSEDKAAYDQNKREDKSFSGEQPVFHQRVAGDSSPESRNALLAQGDMIIIVADELKSFIDSFGRYAKGGNGSGTEVSQLLSTWSNVKDRMNRICKEILGWDKVVSGTWARHSFATNLKLAGVEELYISESMGHSQGNDVTSGYQDMYPLEIRFRNNNKLLNIEKEEEPIDIDSLSPEQMKELLKKMMSHS